MDKNMEIGLQYEKLRCSINCDISAEDAMRQRVYQTYKIMALGYIRASKDMIKTSMGRPWNHSSNRITDEHHYAMLTHLLDCYDKFIFMDKDNAKEFYKNIDSRYEQIMSHYQVLMTDPNAQTKK